MSYSIHFAVKVAGTPKDIYAIIGSPEYNSPTYNIGDLFRACMGWDFRQGEWYKMSDVIPKIERGINELTYNSRAYKQYEPDNGWGSVSGALNCLNSIIAWFKDDFSRGWDEEIPLECIYMKW